MDYKKFIQNIINPHYLKTLLREETLRKKVFPNEQNSNLNISAEDVNNLLYSDKHILPIEEIQSLKEPINKLVEITNKTADSILRMEKSSEQNFNASYNLSKIALILSFIGIIITFCFGYAQYQISKKQYEYTKTVEMENLNKTPNSSQITQIVRIRTLTHKKNH